MIRLCSLTIFVSSLPTALFSSSPLAVAASSSFAIESSESAIAAFSTMFGKAMFCPDDTARNSNLLPVNANGLVRLRSPASRGSFGSTLTPRS